jgi:hypothetical protein
MADRSGYIGRAPGDSSVIIARQTFEPTGVQTNFTFASGYDPGYLDLYLNGIRLIEGSDYNATNGSVVGLTSEAQNGDVVEAIAYKAFNVAAVSGSTGDFTVGTSLVVNQTTTLTGDTTAANINSSGIITASSFEGDGSALTGVISGVELQFDGNSVGTAVTNINFSGVSSVTAPVSGLSTVTISKQLTIGVRVGSAVTFAVVGAAFTVDGRSAAITIDV